MLIKRLENQDVFFAQKKRSDRNAFFNLYIKNYFPLFASATYFSKAPVMDGVPGAGAKISTRNP